MYHTSPHTPTHFPHLFTPSPTLSHISPHLPSPYFPSLPPLSLTSPYFLSPSPHLSLPFPPPPLPHFSTPHTSPTLFHTPLLPLFPPTFPHLPTRLHTPTSPYTFCLRNAHAAAPISVPFYLILSNHHMTSNQIIPNIFLFGLAMRMPPLTCREEISAPFYLLLS